MSRKALKDCLAIGAMYLAFTAALAYCGARDYRQGKGLWLVKSGPSEPGRAGSTPTSTGTTPR